MNWIVKFIDGNTIQIEDEEYKAVLSKPNGLIALKRIGHTFNRSSISRILPLADFERENKSNDYKNQIGILHDGTKVTKAFGKWYREQDAYIGSDGKQKYINCQFDYERYPEIALDRVKTPDEFLQWKDTKQDYLLETVGEPKLRLNQGFTKLN